MDVSTILVLIFVGALLVAAYQIIGTNKKQNAMKETISSLPDFTPTQQVMGENGTRGLRSTRSAKKYA